MKLKSRFWLMVVISLLCSDSNAMDSIKKLIKLWKLKPTIDTFCCLCKSGEYDTVIKQLKTHEYSKEELNKKYYELQHGMNVSLFEFLLLKHTFEYSGVPNDQVLNVLKVLLQQKNICTNSVVEIRISADISKTNSFSPLYIILFADYDMKNRNRIWADCYNKGKFENALKVLGIFKDYCIKCEPTQGMWAAVKKDLFHFDPFVHQVVDSQDFYSVMFCLKQNYSYWADSPESKRVIDGIIEALVDVGIDTEKGYTYNNKIRVIDKKLMNQDVSLKYCKDIFSKQQEPQFDEVFDKALLKKFEKSLSAKLQQERLMILCNVHFSHLNNSM